VYVLRLAYRIIRVRVTTSKSTLDSMTSPEDETAELPAPGSKELIELLGSREVNEAYRFLYERREDPPTMMEWREESRRIFGKANSQTDRRLRDLRDHFEVEAVRRGTEYVYALRGRSERPTFDKGRRISPRLEAEVYSEKGRFCHMCGRGPEDGVKLALDHIIPRSWGGETIFDNLEPLCEEHNHGKQAFFASLDPYADKIRLAIGLPTPWERIGELLKVFQAKNRCVPASLLPVVARETHRGDPARRLRDLRVVLGWDIRAHRKKEHSVTSVEYELRSWKPWPPEGPKQAVAEYERRRRARKAGS
jgi:5-methylcytosine-specific restriction endonuclease McrA